MHLFVQAVIAGILVGGMWALLASGQAMIFGATRTINFAQAIFTIVAAYVSYSLYTHLGLDPFLSVLLLVPAMFVVGVLVHVVFLRRLSSSPELSLLVLFALAIGIQGVLDLAYSTNIVVTTPSYANNAWIVAGYEIPVVRAFGFLLAIVILTALHLFGRGTKPGRAMRATTQNPTSARLLGIDVDRMSMLGMGLGLATTGAAGAVYGMVFPFNGNSQYDLLSLLLSISVLGGVFSMPGIIVAAMVVGVTESTVAVFISPDWSSFSFLVLLFVALLVRPQGLFGHRLRGAL